MDLLIPRGWELRSITARGIELTREIGFDTIDIFADPLEINAHERRLFEKRALESTSGISTVCCALGIADFNKPVRDFHVHRAKSYLDLCYELEGKNLLLVLGEYIWQQEVIAPQDQWKWAVEHVRELAEYASRLGLEIAIELEPFHLSLINNIGRMSRFLADVDYPAAKANVDISHLALAKDAASEISKLKGRIAHVHLSDCDGKKHGDLPPGRGVVDFPPYLKRSRTPASMERSALNSSTRRNRRKSPIGFGRHIPQPVDMMSLAWHSFLEIGIRIGSERMIAYGIRSHFKKNGFRNTNGMATSWRSGMFDRRRNRSAAPRRKRRPAARSTLFRQRRWRGRHGTAVTLEPSGRHALRHVRALRNGSSIRRRSCWAARSITITRR